MKTVKYLTQLLVLSLFCLGLASCGEDQEMVDSAIVGRSWTGDVGLSDEWGVPLVSTFSFGLDGFGQEMQRYPNGRLYDTFNFQWWWEDPYSRNLVLDYGRYGGISYMDNVRVGGNQLWGTFFLSDHAPGFDFVLYME